MSQQDIVIVAAARTAIGKFGPKGEVEDRSGLVVHEKGKEIASFKCIRAPTSELGPGWFGKAGIRDGGQSFDLPD